MKNPSTISSGESDERAAFEAHMRRTFPGLELALGNDGVYRIWRVENDWMLWQARAALAPQPAESKACASVGEPVIDPLQGAADWLKTGLVDVTVADIQSRLLIGYNRARRLFDGATPPAAPAAPKCSTCNDHGMIGGLLPGDGGYDGQDCPDCTPPAAPAATEAPSKPFAYYIHIAAEQRGEFVHDLDEALDDLTNCECKITELFDRATPAPAVGASEREEGFEKYWVARADFDKMSGDLTRAKNLLVRLWDKHPAARAQIEASTGSWFVWGQDRDAPAAVGASVQPVLASPSDEGALSVTCPHCWQKAGEPCIWPDRSRNRGTSHDDRKAAALASSTPTKGGEAS